MSRMTAVHRGVVHGRMIELDQPLPMLDGCEIEVTIRRKQIDGQERQKRLQALFGICAQDADDLDEFLDWNREQRKHSRQEFDL